MTTFILRTNNWKSQSPGTAQYGVYYHSVSGKKGKGEERTNKYFKVTSKYNHRLHIIYMDGV